MTSAQPAMTFSDPREAFEEAIRAGRLSDDPASPIYAGRFMYMGHEDGRALFKHIETRRYLK